MKLLMVTQDFPPDTGGIQTYSYSHANNFATKCEWFGVICPDKKGADKTDQKLHFPVKRLKIRNDLMLFSLFKNLHPFLNENPADATFHSQWQTAAAGIRAREKGLLRKVFVAAHIRELLFNPFEHFPILKNSFIRYRQKVLKNVDHFYPVSDYTAGRLINMGVDESRITVVINGTDPEQFYPESSIKLKNELGLNNKKVILTITRLVKRKGIDTVLEAMKEVIKKVPETHYLIVGDGVDKERLELIVDKKNLTNRVTFTGKVPYDKLKAYYNIGDIFVMPSKTNPPDVEGFGIVFLEANACGLPVIGSDSGGIPSAIKNGKTGFIVPEGNPALLAERMVQLLRDSDLCKKFGNEGRRWVVEEANWTALNKKLIEDMYVRLECA